MTETRNGSGHDILDISVRSSARAHAVDLYLSALLGPADVRDDLIALAAFKGEIERVGLIAREPLVGEIRLQWWRERLEDREADGQSGNPITEAVKSAIARHKLDRGLVGKMIDAQVAVLYERRAASWENYLAHVADFDGAAFALGARVLVSVASPRLDEATRAGGRAYGTGRVLTRLRVFAARGYWPLPPGPSSSDRVLGADFVAERELAGERRLSVEHAIRVARADLAEVAGIWAELPERARAALLPLALAAPYFKSFERRRGDPLMMELDVSPLSRRMTLWLARLRGVF